MSLGKHVVAGVTTILMVALLVSPTLSCFALGLVIELFGLVGEDGPFLTTFFLILTATASQIIPEYIQHEIVYDIYLFCISLIYWINSEYVRGVIIALAILRINRDTGKLWLYVALEVLWISRPILLPSMIYLKKLIGPEFSNSITSILEAIEVRFFWLSRCMKQKAKGFKRTPATKSPTVNLPELSYSSIMIMANIPPFVNEGIQAKPTYVDASTQGEEFPRLENDKTVEILPERLLRRWDTILYFSASGSFIKKVWKLRKAPTYDRSIPIKVFLPPPVSANAKSLIEASEPPPVGLTLPAAAEIPEHVSMGAGDTVDNSEQGSADALVPVPATTLEPSPMGSPSSGEETATAMSSRQSPSILPTIDLGLEGVSVSPAISPVSPIISVSDSNHLEPVPIIEEDAETYVTGSKSVVKDDTEPDEFPRDEPKAETEAVQTTPAFATIETDSAPVAAYEPASEYEELTAVSSITETNSVPDVVKEAKLEYEEPTTMSVVAPELEDPTTNVAALTIGSAVESVVPSSTWPSPVIAPVGPVFGSLPLPTISKEEEEDVPHSPVVVSTSEGVPFAPVSVIPPTTAVPTIALSPVVESSPSINDTVMIDSDDTPKSDDEEMGGTGSKYTNPPDEMMAEDVQDFEAPIMPVTVSSPTFPEWNAPSASKFRFTVPASFAQYPAPSQSPSFVPVVDSFSFTADGPVPPPFFSPNPSSMSGSTTPHFPYMPQEMEQEPTVAETITALVEDENMGSNGSPSPGDALVDVNMENIDTNDGGNDSDDEEVNELEMVLNEELMKERSAEAQAQVLADIQKAKEDVAAQREEQDRAICAAHGFNFEPESDTKMSEYDSQAEDNIIPRMRTVPPTFQAQPDPEPKESEVDTESDIEFIDVPIPFPGWTPITQRTPGSEPASVPSQLPADTPRTSALVPSPSPRPINPNGLDARERASVGNFYNINKSFLLESKRPEVKKIIIPEPTPPISSQPDEADEEDEEDVEDEFELPPLRKIINPDFYRGYDNVLHKLPVVPPEPLDEEGVALSMAAMIEADEYARAAAEAQQLLIEEEQRRMEEEKCQREEEKRRLEEEAARRQQEEKAEEEAKKSQEWEEKKRAKNEADLKRLLAKQKKPVNIFIPKKKHPRPPPGGNGGDTAMKG